ncbi:PEP-CTERM sorting domain-containing protein [Nostoc commune]|uniref:PEP-CTERM sorting domain-containing protein n=1 Tax=Nostoc commune TaxID=1178 RepID=UPI0018C6FB3B|nr:PEP-CTERM sorting domain-containing protein [Nostoc commune]MBG1262237.1 PEP-CTERM sorting domain-containing protein [Nostoc commune BAE]
MNLISKNLTITDISLKCIASLGTLLSVCSSASIAESATITPFTNRNDFNTNIGATPLIREDFTDNIHYPITRGILNSQTNLVVENGPPIRPGDIKPGATYSTQLGTGFFFNIDAGGGYTGGFLDAFPSSDFNRTLTIDFDKNVSAFGFDTNSLMGNDFDLTIKFSSGESFVQNFLVSNSQSLQFFGFQSDAFDIQSVIIDGNTDRSDGGPFAFALDNFTFTTVPEPSSLGGTVIAGFMGLWLKRKKQKGSQSV